MDYGDKVNIITQGQQECLIPDDKTKTEEEIPCYVDSWFCRRCHTQGFVSMTTVPCLRSFSGQYCEIEMNECDSTPCLNGAVCQDDVNSYDCFCPEGFEGLNCEINFDECTYGFCKSNSTCLDLVADYSCVCPPGFTDKNCSTDIDECFFKPCKNGGDCHDLIGEFYCSCLPGKKSVDV
ncbi:hypothetical protein AV530_005774 [Patagioenas fasciata monilis]|uniref:EGF-like domain-containing protein n=1 Tax=Patagioenas fasciata monilis TaxID=372326 RepID=A0A1V4JNW3_PATFA|nr:hypothetical protein AV530_005774 [Patagioenas fasciata monilis]